MKADFGALRGIYNRNGFFGEETLIHIIMGDSFPQIEAKYLNDRARTLRDSYRQFDEKIRRCKGEVKRRELQDAWIDQALRSLGYGDSRGFIAAKVPHPEGGSVPFLRSSSESHSVAIFICNSTNYPSGPDETGYFLTTKNGSADVELSKIESLTEQVERSIRDIGLSDALLFLPHCVCYFRSDRPNSGQYLEIRWDELLLSENDRGLALCLHLIAEDCFAFETSAPKTISEDEEEQEEEEDSDDIQETSSGSSSIRTNRAAHLSQEDLAQARRITEELYTQVALALEVLINERLAIEPELFTNAKSEKRVEALADQLFREGLFFLYRIFFILFGEAKEFLPVRNERYRSFYSMDHLSEWTENFQRNQRRGRPVNPDGNYLWEALHSLFTLLRRGVSLPGGETVSPYNGQLFSPDQMPLFEQKGKPLRDSALSKVITALTRKHADEFGQRLNYENLGVLQLGAVYESLLAQKPIIVTEKSSWVPAHGGGAALVTEKIADALKLSTFDTAAKKERDRIEGHISPKRAAFHPKPGVFVLDPNGAAKGQTATYYTPPKLAEYMVSQVLGPLVKDKKSDEILSLRCIEPAVGSGSFLIAALRFLGRALLNARLREKDPSLVGRRPTNEDEQRCKRDVLEKCLYATDVNPLALELCQMSLYLETLGRDPKPLPFLRHRIKHGNSLFAADFRGLVRTKLANGQDIPSVFHIPLEVLSPPKAAFEAWQKIEKCKGKKGDVKALQESWKDKLAAVREEKKRVPFDDESWAGWALASQQKIRSLLRRVVDYQLQFDLTQGKSARTDHLDQHFRDELLRLPEQDDVLIETAGVEVDAALRRQRERALHEEYGPTFYGKLVERRRAYYRLRTFGDLVCSLWFWPLEKAESFPNAHTFRRIVDWLLDEVSLDAEEESPKLDSDAQRTLEIVSELSRNLGFFHPEIEFAPVFYLDGRSGFDAVISNPPWKVVGRGEDEIFAAFDPQFKAIKKSQRTGRKALVFKNIHSCANQVQEFHVLSKRIAEFARSGISFEPALTGQLDLSCMFLLRFERLVQETGRMGGLVSRAAAYINNGSKGLRERLFSNWGLEQSVSFVNELDIFSIHRQTEFSLLVGSVDPVGKQKSPYFTHGLLDPAALDALSSEENANAAGIYPVRISKAQVETYLGPGNLTIPGLSHPRQRDIIIGLREAQGTTLSLAEIQGCAVKSGIHQRSGPRDGVSQFVENIPERELPTMKSVLRGETGEWIPLYRGRFFSILDPVSGAENVSAINSQNWLPTFSYGQYARKSVCLEKRFPFERPKVVWRAMTNSTNSRSLIVSIIPDGFWADNKVWLATLGTAEETLGLAILFGSLALDFLIRPTITSTITVGAFNALPLTSYRSPCFDEAMRLTRQLIGIMPSSAPGWLGLLQKEKPILSAEARREAQARIDALVWLHYGANKGALDRENLQWLLETQFPVLKRQDSMYGQLVLKFYDEYVARGKAFSQPTGELFRLIRKAA